MRSNHQSGHRPVVEQINASATQPSHAWVCWEAISKLQPRTKRPAHSNEPTLG